MKHNDVLTLEEAAARFKLAPKTVRDWVYNGKLPGFKLRRMWRVRASAMEAFVDVAASQHPLRLVEAPDASGDA
jgi:excisionase family DNA binding protein